MFEQTLPQRPAGTGRSLTIRRKMLLAFLAMAAIMAVFGWSAVRSIKLSGALVVEAFDRSLMSVNHARAAQAGFTALRADLAEALAMPTRSRDGLDERLAVAGEAVLEDLTLARGRVLSADSVAAIDGTIDAVTEWLALARAAVLLPTSVPTHAPAVSRVIDAFELLINFVAGDAFRGRQQSLATIERQRLLAIGAVLLALILSAIISGLLARRMVSAIASASHVAGNIADGHLEVDIPPGGADELGQLLRSMASMRDNIRVMVERERAQRRSAQTRLVDALEGSREGVVLVDSDGAVLLANSQARAFLPDLTLAFVPGTQYDAMLEAARAQGLLRSPADMDPSGDASISAESGTQEAQLADGRWLRIARSAITEGGFVAIWSEITVLKERETVLREARDRAEAASRAKTEFLANMSHELRTPLNAVIGFSELISSEIFGPVGQPKYKEYAGDILRSGGHLLNIINDILSIAKSEAGKLTLDLSEVALHDVFEECRRMMVEASTRANLTLTVADVASLPAIHADSVKLQQILLNLLSNAIKFTPAGGRVTLTARRCADMVAVAINDTGIGMSPDEIPIALAPFGQVDSSLARKYEGTGLGLPLTKAFVDLHGGTLEIASSVGVGTTVTVTFPVAAVAGAQRAA